MTEHLEEPGSVLGFGKQDALKELVTYQQSKPQVGPVAHKAPEGEEWTEGERERDNRRGRKGGTGKMQERYFCYFLPLSTMMAERTVQRMQKVRREAGNGGHKERKHKSMKTTAVSYMCACSEAALWGSGGAACPWAAGTACWGGSQSR